MLKFPVALNQAQAARRTSATYFTSSSGQAWWRICTTYDNAHTCTMRFLLDLLVICLLLILHRRRHPRLRLHVRICSSIVFLFYCLFVRVVFHSIVARFRTSLGKRKIRFSGTLKLLMFLRDMLSVKIWTLRITAYCQPDLTNCSVSFLTCFSQLRLDHRSENLFWGVGANRPTRLNSHRQ